MSAGKHFNNLLPAQQTIALLELIQRYPQGGTKSQLQRDLTAHFPAVWAKSENTIEFLCAAMVLTHTSGVITIAGESSIQMGSSWFNKMRETIAGFLTQRIASGEFARCLQTQEDGSLWLDSMLISSTYSGLASWMIEFEVASRERIGARFWLVSSTYRSSFMEAAGMANQELLRKAMSSAQLQSQLERQSSNGLLAEEWVVSYEKRRLASHPLLKQIQRISDQNVAAGYDIVSFSNSTILHHDLFIEVKSYSGQKRFFWSRNEIEVAEKLGEKYCLYLVDLNKLDHLDYVPQIIRGPHIALFNSNAAGWEISPTTFECIAND